MKRTTLPNTEHTPYLKRERGVRSYRCMGVFEQVFTKAKPCLSAGNNSERFINIIGVCEMKSEKGQRDITRVHGGHTRIRTLSMTCADREDN